MTARIFKPAKNAMQSGTAKTREWQLDYEPEQPRVIEPLMGWTSSGDMKQQLTIRFDTKEEAVAYCEREGIPYQVLEPKEPVRRQAAYADNLRSGAASRGPIKASQNTLGIDPGVVRLVCWNASKQKSELAIPGVYPGTPPGPKFWVA